MPALGFAPANVIIDAKIGPVQGVQPAAKAIPINTDPK